MSHPSVALLILFILVPLAPAVDGPPAAVAALPVLAKPRAVEAKPLPALTTMAPGIHIAADQRVVVLDGRIQMDQGPVDGLEVVACLNGGKSHETCITLDTAAAELVKAAFIAALGVADGASPMQGVRQPARGTPLRVVARWQDPDQPDRALEVDASCLVRDRLIDRPYPPLPFVFTGSRFLPISVPGPDGQPVQRQQFMLASTRTLVAAYDEPDALMAAPFPDSWRDHHFEVHSGIAPPAGTAVRLVISRAELPLNLMVGDGGLSVEGRTLDDAALAALLVKHYGAGASPALRAVGMVVTSAQPAEQDEHLRARLLAVAASAQVWVVPVFMLKP